MRQNVKRGRTLACTSLPSISIRSLITILLYITCYSNGLPIQNDNPTNSTNSKETFDIIENQTITIDTTQWPTTSRINSNPFTYLVEPQRVTAKEWMRMINKGPLITQVAFDIGPQFSPTFAYITQNSYDKFTDDLDEKCRKPNDENIAEVRLDNLNNEYFRWEEFQFNKALLNTLFPETAQRDHSRFLSSNKIINRIRLSNDLESQCQIFEQNDDEWSKRVDEKTQFEDYLINRIFQPRMVGENAQAIINEIEGGDGSSVDETNQRNRREIDISNFTNPLNETHHSILSRKRRSIRNLSRQQLEGIAHLRFREYKAKRGGY